MPKRKIKPSGKTDFWPCGSCRRNSLTESIYCGSCKQWFHANCEQLCSEELYSLEKSKFPYTCNQCFQAEVGDGQYNYHHGLLRLIEALQYGEDSLRIVAKRDNQILPEFELYRKPVISAEFVEVDLNAKALMEKCHLSTIGVPSLTTGDGNCLFNAVSIALSGHEGYSTELRLRTAVDMIINSEMYKSRPDFNDLLAYSPSYEESVTYCCKDSEWSSVFTVMSLSIVIGKPIRSIYPPMNGLSDPVYLALNKVFWSLGRSADENINILWSRQNRKMTMWTANHFVPVIPTADFMPQHDTTHINIDSSIQSPDSNRSVNDPSFNTSTPVGGNKRKADFEFSDKNGNQFKIFKIDLPSQPTEAESNIKSHEAESNVSAHSVNTNVSSSEESNATESDSTLNDDTFLAAVSVKQLTKPHSYEETFKIILERDNVQTVVPPGNKSNSYVLIDNTKNIGRIESNKKCEYYDDCGVWDYSKGNTRKSIFVRDEDSLKEVNFKDSKYCVKRREKGKTVYKPLETQPDQESIVVMRRYYTVLKLEPNFQKRMTFFQSESDPSIGNVALYEYTGSHPVDSQAHGNAKKGKTFVRTHPKTLTEIRKKPDSMKPREIFQEMHLDDSNTAPRDFQVIKNIKSNAKKEAGRISKSNVADEILEVLDMINTHPFVQTMIHTKDKVPSVICYTQEQVMDLRQFLIHDRSEPIGIDRTFNLGSFYVTSLVYKNNRILRKDTGTNPVFIGPMLLHKDATYPTYKAFLEHVATAVDCDIDNVEMRMSDQMEFGSDDEKALTKAIDHVFPKATRVLCTKHLKDNVNFYMQNKVGMDRNERVGFVTEIFGPGGIIDSNCTVDFELKSSNFQEKLRENHPNPKPRIEKYVFEPTRKNHSKRNWTNNSAESINNIMKLSVNWKPQNTKDLIMKLYGIVELHYIDYRAALHGQGNYVLATDEKLYQIHDSVWRCKSSDEKRLAFTNFLKDTKKRQKTMTITSKDGKFSVINKAKGVARKPGQRKRGINERTKKR